MRVLVLADEAFALREKTLISRLEVGLADEGVRVVHAIPRRASVVGTAELFTQTVTYDDQPMPFGDRFRARRLALELNDLAGDPPLPLSVIHVFGGTCWGFARLLSERTGAALALEVWRAGLAGRAGRSPWSGLKDVAFLCPDPSIDRMLRNVGAPTIRSAPWGVHVGQTCRRTFAEERVPGVMIIGGGRDAGAMHAVLEGLAAARKRGCDFFAFFDAGAAQRAGVWAMAERLALLDRLTLIEQLEGRRDLLLQGDVLIYPDHSGEQRSIVLDAMGAGMAVLAAPDPHVSFLQEGRTCRLVQTPGPHAWRDALVEALADPEASRRLGRNAWEYVRAERPAARYVQAVLDCYAWLTAHNPVPISAAR